MQDYAQFSSQPLYEVGTLIPLYSGVKDARHVAAISQTIIANYLSWGWLNPSARDVKIHGTIFPD